MRRPHVLPGHSARLLGRLCMLLLACGGLVGPVPDALANDITVNSTSDTSDPGKCRLRDAILAANTHVPVGDCPAGQPGSDTIHFNWGLIFCPLSGCQIKLFSPLPQITEDLTIDGTGQFPTISGNHSFRIFDFDVVTATVSNLYLIDGQNANGGAIHAHGTTLSLDHVHISNSRATTSGGAIQTRALLDGSPALNHGSPAAPGSGGLACEAADQRGVLRPLGSACDVGAFEAGLRAYLPAIRR